MTASGCLFSFYNKTLYEALGQHSATSENAAETGHELTFWWAITYVLGEYLLPVVFT